MNTDYNTDYTDYLHRNYCECCGQVKRKHKTSKELSRELWLAKGAEAMAEEIWRLQNTVVAQSQRLINVRNALA